MAGTFIGLPGAASSHCDAAPFPTGGRQLALQAGQCFIFLPCKAPHQVITVMTTPTHPSGAPQIDEHRGLLSYRGWRFQYQARRTSSGFYEPVVQRLCGQPGGADLPRPEALPNDTEEIAYSFEEEALRHAQQQAIRWVNDRSGTGQGQF